MTNSLMGEVGETGQENWTLLSPFCHPGIHHPAWGLSSLPPTQMLPRLKPGLGMHQALETPLTTPAMKPQAHFP